MSPVEVHDLVCKIGDVVVSGGVRRSALISLSDLSNFDMAKAKSGSWWEQYGHRALANNTAVYYDRPNPELFLREWRNLIESQSGERGLLNLTGVRAMAPARRDATQISGTNPCGEISLRSMGLCNSDRGCYQAGGYAVHAEAEGGCRCDPGHLAVDADGLQVRAP